MTPLSRRIFNSSGLVVEDLAPQREATIKVAKASGFDYIDLNAASVKYLNSIGSTKAANYNLATGDFTHLNDVGSVVFGDMVSLLLTTTTSFADEVMAYTKPSAAITEDIENGVYIYPSS